MKNTLLLFVLLTLQGCATAQDLTDADIKNILIEQSIRSYSGACPCPYNVMRNADPWWNATIADAKTGDSLGVFEILERTADGRNGGLKAIEFNKSTRDWLIPNTNMARCAVLVSKGDDRAVCRVPQFSVAMFLSEVRKSWARKLGHKAVRKSCAKKLCEKAV